MENDDIIINSSTYISLMLSTTFCSISVIFTSFFIYFYIRFGDILKNFACQLVLILSISDMCCWSMILIMDVYILSTGIPATEFENTNCQIIGFFLHLNSIITIIIVFLISFLIYLTVVWNLDILKYGRIIIAISILILILLCIVPFFLNDYGASDEQLCWLKGAYSSFFEYYFIIIIILIIDFYFIRKTLIKINKQPYNENYKLKLKKYLIFFPFIFLICFSIGALKSILELMDIDIPYWITIIDYTLQPLNGLLNPLAYMLINDNVSSGVKKIFKKKEEESLLTSDISQIENIIN